MKSKKMKQHIYRYCSGLSVGYWKILLQLGILKYQLALNFRFIIIKMIWEENKKLFLLYLSNKNGILGNIT